VENKTLMRALVLVFLMAKSGANAMSNEADDSSVGTGSLPIVKQNSIATNSTKEDERLLTPESSTLFYTPNLPINHITYTPPPQTEAWPPF